MLWLWILMLPGLAMAQSSVTTSIQRDLNGNRVEGPSISEVKQGDSTVRSELQRTVNGTVAPREKVEERVIRDDSSGRVVERMIRKFDPTGKPGPIEKVVTEERKSSTGSITKTTVFRSDLNGTLAPVERSVSQTSTQGPRLSTETVVERPSLDGSFQAVEKKSAVRINGDSSFEETSSTYRSGAQGFYEAAREITRQTKSGNKSTEQTTHYEVGSSGVLEAHGQSVKRITNLPNGEQIGETDLYRAAGGTLKLQERETVEKRIDSEGTSEVVKVQRPTVSDPGKLGQPVVVSETVCRGKCR